MKLNKIQEALIEKISIEKNMSIEEVLDEILVERTSDEILYVNGFPKIIIPEEQQEDDLKIVRQFKLSSRLLDDVIISKEEIEMLKHKLSEYIDNLLKPNKFKTLFFDFNKALEYMSIDKKVSCGYWLNTHYEEKYLYRHYNVFFLASLNSHEVFENYRLSANELFSIWFLSEDLEEVKKIRM